MTRGLWLAICLFVGVTVAEAQPVLPAGFADAAVANVPAPTGLAFTPDGRLLITTQSGRLRIYRNGTLLATPALDLSGVICTDSERGLLGVAVDPNFAANGRIYLFYSYRKHGVCERNTPRAPVNRVSRFVLSASDTVSPASEAVLIDNIPSPNGNHNGGDLQFGRDGLLYVSVGDGGCDYLGDSGCAGANDAARDPHVLLGKILRIAPDGSIPSSNPFLGANSVRCNVTGRANPGQVCRETFASGLRNPFRIAFDPNAGGTRFFINDVGQNAWEEINLGEPGADYGWNIREGACINGSTTNCGAPPGGLTDPIHAYPHTGGCASITGGAFVPNGSWSSAYDDTYLFSDYVCGTIFVLRETTAGTFTRSTFATGLGGSSAVAMVFGPHQGGTALYYTTYAGGGQVRRIAASANRPPVAAAAATPLAGPAPLTVSFNAAGSSDPDGDPLSYSWTFGDNTPAGSGATVSHTYQTSGRYTAILTVRDSQGATDSLSLTIDAGNRPPVPSITSPASTALYSVGEVITLRGSATDPEDGTLAASRLSWRVILHHNTHTHPYLGPVTGSPVTFQAPAPEDLAATSTSYLEIELTATDSRGLATVVRQNLRPRLVTIGFASQPSGLRLVVNGVTLTTPQQVTSWPNYQLNVQAVDQTDASGTLQTFVSWSDGGAASHTIVTPATATTYTATFAPARAFQPVADTFVRGGPFAAVNYGTQTSLEVKESSGAEFIRRAYLKFDTSAVTSASIARLRIYGALADTRSSNLAVGVHPVPGAWTESAVNWNTRPSHGAAVATFRVLDATPRYYDVDVSAYVRAEKAAGRHVINLALVAGASSPPIVAFNSREAGGNRPELVITGGTTPPAGEIVLYAIDGVRAGTWQIVPDATAAGGARMGQVNAGTPKLAQALAAPTHYVDLTFQAEAGRPYRLWIRGKAESNHYSNDSAYVQFSGSVTASGAPVFRIGTTSATTYVLEECSGCALNGWGWEDNGYGAGVLGPEIYFATTGRQTIRIQTREDGLSIDQVVLSPVRYLTSPPGAVRADATILPRSGS